MSNAFERLIAELAARQPRQEERGAATEAAVALLLTPDPDRLLLIRRVVRRGDPWSGHLALPGGRRDPGDHDLLETAIRETREEIGVLLKREWCVAQLDDLGPITRVLPPIVVRPYVFRLSRMLPTGISDEVAQASWIRLQQLRRTARAHRLMQLPEGERDVVGYELEQGFLWGMTERMITPVIARWEELQLQS